ncbi:MAG TPA: glycine cleavage system protein R [Thiotrichales bacterium]|nr:glycine cleavage system protein R [Thiotrichales bacterium]
MNKQLVITAVGSDHPGIVNELSRIIVDCGCNIEESRMSVLGGEFTAMLLVSGNWNTIAKLESALKGAEQRLEMHIFSKATEEKAPRPDVVPYAADVVALDHPGIVHSLASFFSARNINIEELVTSSYKAAHTGTPMFSVHMEVGVPARLSIAELRDAFMDFCDQLNLDAVLEPIKG